MDRRFLPNSDRGVKIKMVVLSLVHNSDNSKVFWVKCCLGNSCTFWLFNMTRLTIFLTFNNYPQLKLYRTKKAGFGGIWNYFIEISNLLNLSYGKVLTFFDKDVLYLSIIHLKEMVTKNWSKLIYHNSVIQLKSSLLENYFSSICEASYNGIYSSWRYQLNLLQTLRGGSGRIENDNNLYITSYFYYIV